MDNTLQNPYGAASAPKFRVISFPVGMVLLSLFYLVTHLTGLGSLPIFVDEGIHLSWVRAGIQGQSLFESFGIGKTLSVMIWIPFVRLFGDPLMTARTIDVFAGLITVLAVTMLGAELYSRRVGLIAGALLAVLPFHFFYSRLAFTDNFMMAFGMLSLWLSVCFIKRHSSPGALILAFIFLSLAFLAKLPGALLVPFPILAAWWFSPRRLRLSNTVKVFIIVTGAISLIAIVLSWGFGVRELTGRPPGDMVENFMHNLPLFLEWQWILITPPLALTLCAGAVYGIRANDQRAYWLLGIGVAVTAFFLLTAAAFYSRYTLIGLLPMLILAAVWLNDELPRFGRTISAVVGIAVFAPMLMFDGLLIAQPEKAPLPASTYHEFVSGWASGYGIDELNAQLRLMASRGPVTVYRRARWDVIAEGVDLTIGLHPGLTLRTAPLNQPLHSSLFSGAYFVLNKEGDLSLRPDERIAVRNGTLIWQYRKPGGNGQIELWRYRFPPPRPVP